MNPSIGRIVHYVLSKVDCEKMAGKSRPGIVVALGDARTQPVNLQVFTNGGHDELPPVHWKRDVEHDENRTPGTWHWPPREFEPDVKPAENLEELKKQLEHSRSVEKAAEIEKAIEKIQKVEMPTLDPLTLDELPFSEDPKE